VLIDVCQARAIRKAAGIGVAAALLWSATTGAPPAIADDATAKLVGPMRADAVFYVFPLAHVGARLPHLRVHGGTGRFVVGAVRRDPRRRSDAWATVAILGRKTLPGGKLLFGGSGGTLTFSGYPRRVFTDSRHTLVLPDVIARKADLGRFRGGCRPGALVDDATRSVRARRLSGSPFGGLSASAALRAAANEACDRDYPGRDAFRAALGVKPPP
jgi:hypothetical protein